MPSGCVIQVPTLETGDRLIIVERTKYIPTTIPVTFPDEFGDAITIRYFNLEDLPADLKSACEEHLRSISD